VTKPITGAKKKTNLGKRGLGGDLSAENINVDPIA
jgi:hypothetical protein